MSRHEDGVIGRPAVPPAVSARLSLVCWFVVGAAYGFGLAALLSIGLLLLLFAAAGTALLVRRSSTRRGWPSALLGAAVPLIYLAYLNRSGPGTVCTTTRLSQSCTDEYSPWPFVAAAGVLIIIGISVMSRRPHTRG